MKNSHPTLKRPTISILLCSVLLSVASCGFERYTAKPIDAQALAKAYAEKSVNNSAFENFLQNNGYAKENLPIKTWDLNALILCSLFFNPSLDEARAQLRLSELNAATAGLKPLPTLNTNVGKSDRANGDINPFSYTLSLDIALETAGKRNIRLENAAYLSEVAKLNIAQTMWQLRINVASSYQDLQNNAALLTILAAEKQRREAIVSMMQKRVDVGVASNVELSAANLQLQQTALEYNQQRLQTNTIKAALASHLGLPLSSVNAMQFAQAPDLTVIDRHIFDTETYSENAPDNSDALSDDLQTRALINRLDIRTALVQYAIAENAVKLEIAKQYPDLVISPGYAYEFGDRVWSLGLSGLLNLLTKNKVAIESAKALRDVESAKFNRLQSQVINEIEQNNAAVSQTKGALKNQYAIYQSQRLNAEQMDKKFKLGEIDHVELNYAQLELQAGLKQLALSYQQYQMALIALENSVQAPLN